MKEKPGLESPLNLISVDLTRWLVNQYESWTKLQVNEEYDESELKILAGKVEDAFEAMEREGGDIPLDDAARSALYNSLGCIRSLIESVVELRRKMQTLHWDRWMEARF
jgi:hypothetical protein